MDRNGLIKAIADSVELEADVASRFFTGFVNVVAEALNRGEKISLTGFGTFSVTERESRTGRNPRTGQSLEIPATKVLSFKAGNNLKEAIKDNNEA